MISVSFNLYDIPSEYLDGFLYRVFPRLPAQITTFHAHRGAQHLPGGFSEDLQIIRFLTALFVKSAFIRVKEDQELPLRDFLMQGGD